ncbi:Carboxylesterase NlhH [Anatilimnocola aggregata]|uniref:Carboxylesterase NlhH n=1 Tax=Anatilimnocola aggregata TaxID=2528021 RepID=A0A517YCD4_9BACT|nr:alpha/beta hydrolase [Anatilimnocola aggregata]QDU27881.1 Carboxylesterase NlhH [Anatilimnocola aggregata]
MRTLFLSLLSGLATFALVSVASSVSSAQSPQVEKDIPYLGKDRQETGDLYLPAERKPGTKSPAVLIIHGGGWTGGSKRAGREQNIGKTLTEHGMVGFSIDYKLGERGNAMGAWPQNLHDCKTAVRWLRVNAEKYGIDPDRIGVIGGSAGGHLSSLIAVTQEKDGLDPKAPWGDVSTQVRCVVDLYGPIAVRGDQDGATAITKYLDKNDPPFLIMHGTKDTTVPVATSEKLSEAVKAAGIEQELVIIEGAPHTFHLQPKQQDLRPTVMAFFKKHLLK